MEKSDLYQQFFHAHLENLRKNAKVVSTELGRLLETARSRGLLEEFRQARRDAGKQHVSEVIAFYDEDYRKKHGQGVSYGTG